MDGCLSGGKLARITFYGRKKAFNPIGSPWSEGLTVFLSLLIYFRILAKSSFRLISELMPVFITFGESGIKTFVVCLVVSFVISDVRRLRQRALLYRSRKDGVTPPASALPAKGAKPGKPSLSALDKPARPGFVRTEPSRSLHSGLSRNEKLPPPGAGSRGPGNTFLGLHPLFLLLVRSSCMRQSGCV